MRTSLIFGFLILVLCSCQQKEVSLNGNWEAVGSGWLLQIQDSTSYSFYDYTELSCLSAGSGDLSELMSQLELKNDTLALKKGVITYKFTKSDGLPDPCVLGVDPARASGALYNFDVFAQTVEEHYAFMELNKIDWPLLRKQQRQKVLENPTDLNLYLVIEETLELLNDNHGFLEADDELYTALEQIEQEDESESEEDNLPEYGDFQVAAMVADTFLTEDLTKDSPLISWGKVSDSLGFIQIKAMWLYGDLDIPQNLIDEMGYVDAYVTTFQNMYEGDYIQKEAEAVAKIMDRVMADLKDSQAIIIDVRFNGGGQDAVSFEILNRFTDKRVQIATQKLRAGDGFSPILSLFLEGTADAYLKPVYVLTSPQTGSAAEAFSIATMTMGNVKRIGSPTSGAMSTALEKSLPNGWHFAISNEIYMDNSGKAYENLGIPPDYKIEYSKDRQEFFRSVVDDLEGDKAGILKVIQDVQK